jgi:hypothetical protein
VVFGFSFEIQIKPRPQMSVVTWTGKPPTKRRKQITEKTETKLCDWKFIFTCARITGDETLMKKSRAGLSRHGVNPASFVKTLEYLFLADKFYKANPDLIEERPVIFRNSVKIARGFGHDCIDTVFLQ